jgi:hypothetical protein
MTEKDNILEHSTKIYENSSEIKILQEKLDGMLSAIDKVNLDYNKGKIPKEVFENDDKKLRKQSVGLIMNINKLVNDNLIFLKAITNEALKIEKEKVKKEPKKQIKAKKKKMTEKINIQKIETGSSIYQISPVTKN